MGATIYTLDHYRRPSSAVPVQAVPTAFRDNIKDQLTQTIVEDYADWPWPVVQQAIQAACRRIDTDGTLLDAVEAAEQVFLDNRRATDHLQLELLEQRRKRRRDAFFECACRQIEDRMADRNGWLGLEKHYALVRARRVIDGGGTIGAALRHALGEKWLG